MKGFFVFFRDPVFGHLRASCRGRGGTLRLSRDRGQSGTVQHVCKFFMINTVSTIFIYCTAHLEIFWSTYLSNVDVDLKGLSSKIEGVYCYISFESSFQGLSLLEIKF